MTAKEKVLAAYPMAECWMATDNEFWISLSDEDDGHEAEIDYGWGETEEAAWQNAAESLPAQPKFKCGTCSEPVSIYQNIWLRCAGNESGYGSQSASSDA